MTMYVFCKVIRCCDDDAPYDQAISGYFTAVAYSPVI